MLQPWRWLSDYVSGERPDLNNLLRSASGIYLIARPRVGDRVSLDDLLYVGLAGGNPNADGTFEQRIRSHAAKLQRGGIEPGCPQAWAQYHQEFGGPDALRRHALRLFVMPARTEQEKAGIRSLEAFLLMVWESARLQRQPAMPRLNARPADLRLIEQLFEGPIEATFGPAQTAGVPNATALPPQLEPDVVGAEDVLEAIWPNNDEAMQQDERLAQYGQFFEAKGQATAWVAAVAAAQEVDRVLRVIPMQQLLDQGLPGELRISTMPAGAIRAKKVHAIVVPERDGLHIKVQTRFAIQALPVPWAALARPCRRGNMQSELTLPTASLPDVVRLCAQR